jgi:hypothetical protein
MKKKVMLNSILLLLQFCPALAVVRKFFQVGQLVIGTESAENKPFEKIKSL